MKTLFHDGLARFSFVRRNIHTDKTCANCGNPGKDVHPYHTLKRLFQYGTKKDDSLHGNISWDSRLFCSVGCRRSFYN